jgi:hypothetical protein
MAAGVSSECRALNKRLCNHPVHLVLGSTGTSVRCRCSVPEYKQVPGTSRHTGVLESRSLPAKACPPPAAAAAAADADADAAADDVAALLPPCPVSRCLMRAVCLSRMASYPTSSTPPPRRTIMSIDQNLHGPPRRGCLDAARSSARTQCLAQASNSSNTPRPRTPGLCCRTLCLCAGAEQLRSGRQVPVEAGDALPPVHDGHGARKATAILLVLGTHVDHLHKR